MARGFLQSLDDHLRVFSAGTSPAVSIHPNAILVMKESGIDISGQKPVSVNQYLNESWDYVITVCDNARETCPYFPGQVRTQLHMGFDDPSTVVGSENFIWSEFRRVRDEIKKTFYDFYTDRILPELKSI